MVRKCNVVIGDVLNSLSMMTILPLNIEIVNIILEYLSLAVLMGCGLSIGLVVGMTGSILVVIMEHIKEKVLIRK